MANKDKALREGGLAALCRHLVEYFKKTDTAGATLIQLAEATEQGFSDAETGIAAAETAQAEHVTFSDGQTLHLLLGKSVYPRLGRLGGLDFGGEFLVAGLTGGSQRRAGGLNFFAKKEPSSSIMNGAAFFALCLYASKMCGVPSCFSYAVFYRSFRPS